MGAFVDGGPPGMELITLTDLLGIAGTENFYRDKISASEERNKKMKKCDTRIKPKIPQPK